MKSGQKSQSAVLYRRIKSRAIEMGYNGLELANELGMSPGTLRNKLCGITPWTWPEVITLALILQMDKLEELMQRYEPDNGAQLSAG